MQITYPKLTEAELKAMIKKAEDAEDAFLEAWFKPVHLQKLIPGIEKVDSEFIASCSPEVIKSLVEEVIRNREALAEIRKHSVHLECAQHPMFKEVDCPVLITKLVDESLSPQAEEGREK